MKLFRFRFISLLLLFLTFCTNQDTGKVTSKLTDFNGSDFPNFQEPNNGLSRLIHNGDSLEITVEYSECGEWGGHNEKILLHKSPYDQSITAHFTEDTVSCNKIVSKNGVSVVDDNTWVIVFDTIVLLTKEGEKMVNLFLHRLLELSLNHNITKIEPVKEDGEEVISVFEGSRIEVRSTSSKIYLSFYNIDQLANTWFEFVRKELVGRDQPTGKAP